MARNNLVELRLDRLDERYPYQTRRSLEDAALEKSIRSRGMLQPLLVHAKGNDCYAVIAGHRRVQALKKLKVKTAAALVVLDAWSDEDCFYAAVLSNWRQPMKEPDCAWLVRRAREQFHLAEERIAEELFPALGLMPDVRLVRQYVSVSKLEAPVLDWACAHDLSLRHLVKLQRFSAGDQTRIYDRLLVQVSLSSSQLLQVLDWLYDLLGMKQKGLAAILSDPLITSLDGQPKDDERQKGERFFEGLRKMRFPRQANQEERFQTARRAIARDAREIQLEAPAHFEDEGFVLKAAIRRPESLDSVIRCISRKKDVLNSLFDIML